MSRSVSTDPGSPIIPRAKDCYNRQHSHQEMLCRLFPSTFHEPVVGRRKGNGETDATGLQEMRKTAVARAYSADKNLAIFLGRPPRINRKFFSTKVLGQIAEDLMATDISKEIWTLPVSNISIFSYDIDTWWSAMCARLKEEALDLSRENDQGEKSRKARCQIFLMLKYL